MEAISKGIGIGEIAPDKAVDQSPKQEFIINLKMKTSDAFKDGEPPEDAEDPEKAAEELKFPWHCEKGIIENTLKLNIEFNSFRGLNPVKIFISGPPASGKSFYAEKLAQYYNIPRVHIKEIIDKAYQMAKVEEDEEGNPKEPDPGADVELIEEIRGKIEELRDAAQ